MDIEDLVEAINESSRLHASDTAYYSALAGKGNVSQSLGEWLDESVKIVTPRVFAKLSEKDIMDPDICYANSGCIYDVAKKAGQSELALETLKFGAGGAVIGGSIGLGVALLLNDSEDIAKSVSVGATVGGATAMLYKICRML